MKFGSRKTTLACAVAATVFASQQLSAQAMLEEVVVTAQKRAQGLQDVPISISAFTGQSLEDAGVQNMEAASESVPNL